jgi:O-antigen/teichoic acid export membrane protein
MTETPAAPASDVLDSPAAGGAAIRGGALRLGGYGLGVLLGLAAAPILVRHLGVVGFGRYTLVLSIVALVQGVTDGGLTAIGLREYSLRDAAGRERLMRELLGLRTLLTAAGVAVATGFTVVAGYPEEVVWGTVLAGLGLILLVLFNLVAVPLQANLRFGWMTIAEVVRQAVMTVLLVVLVVAGAGLVPLLAVQIAAGIAPLVIVYALARRLVPLRASIDRRAWWALARDTLPYAVAIAVSAVYFRITIVLMSLVSTNDETGYFAVSYRVIEALIGVPLLVVGAAFPIISRAVRDDASRLRYAAQRTLDLMLIAGVWTTLVIALAAPFIIDVLAGDGFDPSVGTLRIQALAVVCTFVSVTCGYVLLALHRHTAILVGNLVPLAFGITLTLLLAPAHGAHGAAAATAAAEVGLAVTMFALVRGHGEGRVALSLKPLAGTALAGALAAGAGILLSGVHPVVSAFGATIVFFGVLAATGQIPEEIAAALHARIRTDDPGGTTT